MDLSFRLRLLTRFERALAENLVFPKREVYAAAGAVTGMALKQKQDKGVSWLSIQSPPPPPPMYMRVHTYTCMHDVGDINLIIFGILVLLRVESVIFFQEVTS